MCIGGKEVRRRTVEIMCKWSLLITVHRTCSITLNSTDMKKHAHTCFQSHSLTVVYLTLCFPSCLCQRLFYCQCCFICCIGARRVLVPSPRTQVGLARNMKRGTANESIQVAVVGSIWGVGDKMDGTVIANWM